MASNYKIILYGDYSVGKSCLINRLLTDTFNQYSQSTIGASYSTWVNKDEPVYKFGLWDTAGQERYYVLLPIYLRGSNAVIYCWEYGEKFNESKADSMYEKAIEYSPDCHFYIVITQIDKSKDDNIMWESVEKWALDKNIKGCFYTSSYTGQGVQELFNTVSQNLIKCPIHTKQNIISLSIETLEKKTKCC